MMDPVTKLIAELEEQVPTAPAAYDLRDPVIRRDLLEQPVVHFKLTPPDRIKAYLDGLARPATDSEEEVICDYLDALFQLAPRFCTAMDLGTREIWVTQTEEETRRRRRETHPPAPATNYDLHQLKGIEERAKKGRGQ